MVNYLSLVGGFSTGQVVLRCSELIPAHPVALTVFKLTMSGRRNCSLWRLRAGAALAGPLPYDHGLGLWGTTPSTR